MVIFCNRIPGCLLVSTPFSSSKNPLQSSSTPTPFSRSSSLDDSASFIPLFEYFGLEGLAPNSTTHQALSSFGSVGKVVKRSSMAKRLTGRFGCSEAECLFIRVLEQQMRH